MKLKEQYIRFMSHFSFGKCKEQYKKRWKDIKYSKKSSIKNDFGENNKLILFDDFGNDTGLKYLNNLDIIFHGNNNLLKFHYQLNIENQLLIICSGNNIISVNKSPYPINFSLPYRISPYSKLLIGKNFSSGYTEFRLHQESHQEVIIGDDCMFSNNIYIKPSDGHSIYDSGTLKVLNCPQNIKIGNHCWIGRGCTILKGVNIPNNCIVGVGSIVTKSSMKEHLTGNKIFVGSPAKCIKDNINWARENTELYNSKHINH